MRPCGMATNPARRTPHAPPVAVGVADSNTEESHYVTEKKLGALA